MVKMLSATELADLVTTHAVDVVDVRDAAEWDAGHLPMARNVPLEVLRADPELHLARDRPVAFVCAKGVRSLAAAKLADRFGYAEIYSVDGGVKAWAESRLPLVAVAQAA